MPCEASMIELFGVIFVPLRNFHHDVGRTVGYRLATQSRFRRDARRFIEFVELRVGGLIAGLQPFLHDYVAGRAGAHTTARMIQSSLNDLRNIQNAAGQTIVPIRYLFWIDFNSLASGKKCYYIFLRGRLVFDFFDIGVTAAHLFSPAADKSCSKGRSNAAPLLEDQTSASLRPCSAVETTLFITSSARRNVALLRSSMRLRISL